jgi:membrane protease YdiL (CAAX protease family)
VSVNKLIDWIRHHQVVAFFVITFAITWGLGFSWIAIIRRQQFLLLPLAFVATSGPGLAGILVSAVTNTRPSRGSRRAFWTALAAAWLAALLVCVANSKFLQQSPVTPLRIGLFAVSVLPVAFVIASAWSRNPSIKNYLASLVRFRGVWGWLLLGLLLFPALHLISLLMNSLAFRQPISPDQFPHMSLPLVGLVIVKFLYQFFFFNGTGEETGWRGFALPRLQTRMSPLVAALVIGLFWAPWHFFLWRAVGSPVWTLPFWGEQFALHILSSVFIVWICDRAYGSILVAGVTHAAANTVMAFISLQGMRGLYLTYAVAALALILLGRMWKKLPHDHSAVYRPPEHAAQPNAQPMPTVVP